MRYYSSDWHFSHYNVISYCQRPFKDLEEMNIGIVNIINETVKEDDELFVLGDAALNPKAIELFLPLINCKNLYLVPGNHDQCFPRPDGKKLQKTLVGRERYLNAGFKSIEIYMEIQLGKYKVGLCHFPFGDERGMEYDKRYYSCRPKNYGQWLLHGHLHSKYRKYGKMIDVGLDGDWKIFSEDDIIKLIEDPRDFIPTPLTEFYRQRKEKENGLV